MFFSLPSSNDEEELRRLFYVALTRAQKYLYLSYSRFKPDGKHLEPSMFIAEILHKHELPVEKNSWTMKQSWNMKYYNS